MLPSQSTCGRNSTCLGCPVQGCRCLGVAVTVVDVGHRDRGRPLAAADTHDFVSRCIRQLSTRCRVSRYFHRLPLRPSHAGRRLARRPSVNRFRAIRGFLWWVLLEPHYVLLTQSLPDEKLDYYLTVHLTDFNTGTAAPSFTDERRVPPSYLLEFLSHIQVSYDAAYISSTPIIEQPQPGVTISPPPKATSLLGPSRRQRSIFPPTTPHPIPSAGEADRKYVKSEGTPLTAGIWGDNPAEAFQVLWSRKEKAWVAIFKLVVNVGMFILIYVFRSDTTSIIL